MNLKQLKDYVESFPDERIFSKGISEPFSWMGIYAEVAFRVIDKPMYKTEVLSKTETAYQEEFIGYKGGVYQYGDNTPIHFEENIGEYTDGNYCSKWIAEIEGGSPIISQEERLVKLLFS